MSFGDMSFWFLAAGLTALVLIALLRPLLHARAGADSSAAYDVEVYRDQLREIERARAAGEVTATEAEASKTEIARRLLAADQRRGEGGRHEGGPSRRLLRLSVLALLLILPVGSVALYASLGSPGLPAQPFAERSAAGLAGEGAADAEVRRLTEEAQALAQHLAEAPEDAEAWVQLGHLRLALRSYSAAEEAFRSAEVSAAEAGFTDRERADLLALRGEAQTLAQGGQVTPEARAIFEAALEQAPEDPRARFYLALQRYQSGDLRGALTAWSDLVASAPRGAGWLPLVLARIEEAEEALGIAPGSTVAEVVREREEREALDGLSETEMAAVEGMVASLAARLEEESEDLEGWIRLAQSYEVLGRPAAAAEAWGEAARLDPEDPNLLTRQARALREAAGEIITPETLALMRQVVEIDPDNLEALWFLALEAAARGERREAEEFFDRVFALLPPEAEEAESLRAEAERILGSMD